MKKVQVALLVLFLSTASLAPSFAESQKNPYGTVQIDPAATNEVILTITKGGKRADFAYSRLLKLKHSTISIYEPFLKKRQTFTVISFSTLFSFVGISGNDKVKTRALNDYIFSAKASDFIAAQGYLAIKRNGAPIPYDQGGPIRIIFPDQSKWSKNLDAWNWSLSTISVQ